MATGRTSAASGPVDRRVPVPVLHRVSHPRLALARRNGRPERFRVRRVRPPRRRLRLPPTGPSPSSRAARRRLPAPRPGRSLLPPRKGRRVRPRPRRASRNVRPRARSRPRLRQPVRARRRPSLMRRERRLVTVSAAPRRPRRLPASRPRPLPRHPLAPRRGRLARAVAASLPPRRAADARRAHCRSQVPHRPSRPHRSSGRA